MNKLTAKQLLTINQKLTNVIDESPALLCKVEKISRLPYQRDDRAVYVYKNIVERASVLGSAIATGKPFEMKNNQTAVVAVLTLLKLNDVELENYESNVAELAEYLKSGNLSDSNQWIMRYQCTQKKEAESVPDENK